MTKLLVLVAALITFASPAEATEIWTCTYTYLTRAVVSTHSDPELVRFEVSPPDPSTPQTTSTIASYKTMTMVWLLRFHGQRCRTVWRALSWERAPWWLTKEPVSFGGLWHPWAGRRWPWRTRLTVNVW